MEPAARDSTPPPEGSSEEVNEARSRTSKDRKQTAAEDRRLVERVQAGDETAFRTLFERYHRRAYAVAYGVVKSKEDALDIVQDGFIKVHRHIGRFEGASSFYTWLYRIIMNLSIDHIRRQKNARGVEYDERAGRAAQNAGIGGDLVPRILDTNPAKTVIRRELLTKIDEALATLPEYHRAVIMLREVEGLSYEEMSQLLGVPRGTIMSRLFHARKKMQSVLGEYMQGQLDLEG